MVDLALLQSASYIVASLSASVYLLNLFMTNRRKKSKKLITLSSSVIQATRGDE